MFPRRSRVVDVMAGNDPEETNAGEHLGRTVVFSRNAAPCHFSISPRPLTLALHGRIWVQGGEERGQLVQTTQDEMVMLAA